LTDFYAPDSLVRRVVAEPAVFFGAGRALLLQVAHPSVAQGVADHSEFQANPFKRLFGTLEATYAVTFGSTDLAARVGRRISGIHDHVTGAAYQANDPALLLWVHATLVDTAIGCYERMVQPLTADELHTVYEEFTRAAEVFGCPRDAQPDTYDDFRDYFDSMVKTLAVTETGRHLAIDIVRPILPVVPALLQPALSPPLALFRLAAVGLTPEPLREQFGFRWTRRDQRRLEQVERAAARVFRVTPRPVRVAPSWLQGRYLLRQARMR
jgi:uncharacterized protein (DUF2236 family)